MSKILQELCAAVKAALPTGAPTSAMIEDLVAKVGKLDDAAWNALSEPAADYFNEAVDAVNAGKEPPPLPDWEAPAPAATSRRRTAAQTTAAPTYAVGDDVVVTMKDKSTVTGKVTILDDKGELVLDDGQGEVGVALNLIATVTVKEPPAAPAATSRRRTAAAAEPVVQEPEVSDTVEIINNRDKSYVGNLVEIDDSGVVILTAAGDELPFTREKIKSIVVKVKNAGRGASASAGTTLATDTPPTTGRTRTRTAAAGAPAGDAPVTRSSNRGVSVGTRIRELILDKAGITMEQVGAALKAEGLAFADTSLAMNYKDAHAFLKLLGDRKMLK